MFKSVTTCGSEIALFYEAFGDREAPPVLLVMGNSAPGLVWPDAFCNLLSSTGLFVVRFDARDTGLSTYIDFSTSPYTLDDLAADAFAVLDGIGIAKAHVVGLSQGGVVGYRMALSKPERVTTLCTIMSSPDMRPKNDAFAGAPERPGELPRPAAGYVANVIALNAHAPTSVGEVATRFIENFRLAAGPRSPFDESAWQKLGQAFAERPLLRSDGLQPTLANNSNHALAQKATAALTAEQLGSIGLPMLIIQGSDDPIFPVEHGRWVAAATRHATLRVVERMGHALDPAFFDPIVRELCRFYFGEEINIAR
ncbi:Alpha/beta hydrolase [Caballeronia pedi]|uniref:Alpha/beta hydrolase n=1 Tax=Caballeronia pedi TaxID=1777141 RepID=A0A158C4R3_9BURK|nr:alpha/beta hydrolase [Caballeronia pedi]SAK77271.1 Alpha/beta hydrolase [Caballeronia pedi]